MARATRVSGGMQLPGALMADTRSRWGNRELSLPDDISLDGPQPVVEATRTSYGDVPHVQLHRPAFPSFLSKLIGLPTDRLDRRRRGPPLAGHGAEAARNAIATTITTLPELKELCPPDWRTPSLIVVGAPSNH